MRHSDEHPYERAISRLEKTLDSMKGEVPFIGNAIKDKISELREEKTEHLHATQPLRAKAAFG